MVVKDSDGGRRERRHAQALFIDEGLLRIVCVMLVMTGPECEELYRLRQSLSLDHAGVV